MDSLDDFAIALAIGLPIALIALGNLILALTGERGTLLWPSSRSLEGSDPGPQPAPRSPLSALRRFWLARSHRPS